MQAETHTDRNPKTLTSLSQLSFTAHGWLVTYETLISISLLTGGVLNSSKSSAVVDMLPKRLYDSIRQRPPRNCVNNVSPTFDALNEGDPVELSGSYLVWEN